MIDHGAEVGIDWINKLVIHENDADWHPWDPTIYEVCRFEDCPYPLVAGDDKCANHEEWMT